MDERQTIWEAARILAESGTKGAIATVSRQRGSCPMASDAKMVIGEGGRQWGTIGGGCIEADVVAAALEVAKGGEPRFVSHTLTADAAGDLGLSCGGTAEFFLEPIVATPQLLELYTSVASAIRDRVPLVIGTAADWSRGPKKAVWSGEWGMQAMNVKPHQRPLKEMLAVGGLDLRTALEKQGASGSATRFDEESGILIEPISREPRVVIFGAGHVGVEIAKAASGAGFHVVVYDDRVEFANEERIPWADEVYVKDFRTIFDGLEFDDDDYLLATTRGHNFDALVVEQIAESQARYVGMLGSKRKRAVIFRSLEAAGVSPEALKRVKTPIGLNIGADTPAEIAVSVVAELIRVRRLGFTQAT